MCLNADYVEVGESFFHGRLQFFEGFSVKMQTFTYKIEKGGNSGETCYEDKRKPALSMKNHKLLEKSKIS